MKAGAPDGVAREDDEMAGRGIPFYSMTGFMAGPGDDVAEDGQIALPDPKDAVLLLDFDGTLVEIADRPMEIDVNDRVRGVLSRAIERLDGRVGLVSGRRIDDLEHFLPEFAGPLIGTHGAETRLDGTRAFVADFDEETIRRLQRLVEDFGALRPEFLVEMKPTGVVLHYRQAEEHAGLALRFMESLAAAADGFRLQPALMAYELKPETVGKDVAIRRLLERPEFAGKTPIFAGDDLTDEPAIELVQEQGGVAIKIGEAETCAGHRLHGPSDLLQTLERWLA